MTNILSPTPKQQFFDNNGRPLVGGKLFTYEAGTSTKLDTYVSAGGAANSNPIILDYRGSCDLWIPPNVAYKYVLAPSTDTDPPASPIFSVDNVVSSQLITLYGGVDTGSANAYVIDFTANFASLTDGIIVYWLPSNTNTSTSTLNVNGLGASPILDGSGNPVTAGSIAANQLIGTIYYSGNWQIISIPGNAFGTFTATTTGLTVNATATARYAVSGRIVTAMFPGTLSGPNSNSTAFTITGIPTFLTPGGGSQIMPLPDSSFLDNSAVVSTVRCFMSGSFPGTLTFQLAGNSAGFTAAGAKGLNNNITVTWELS